MASYASRYVCDCALVALRAFRSKRFRVQHNYLNKNHYLIFNNIFGLALSTHVPTYIYILSRADLKYGYLHFSSKMSYSDRRIRLEKANLFM